MKVPKSKFCDSSLLDKAIVFACNAHRNVERRGKGFPYIAHPLEAMSIVATMTNDQELLAAACLHDVIEDTEVTYDEIKKEFGQRVADIVLAESDTVIEGMDKANSWEMRKKIAMDHLANSDRDIQMVALGDKLSNMRAMARDYKEVGEDLWDRFHVNDPVKHEWHYRTLVESFNKVTDTRAFKEFSFLVDKTFSHNYGLFDVNKVANVITIKGSINRENALKIKDLLNKEEVFTLDFKQVYNINFSGLRTLLMMREEYEFNIINAGIKVAHRFDVSGVSSKISILREPKSYDPKHLVQAGDGYTSITYWTSDNDAMVKLYHPFVNVEEAEREKRFATSAMLLGIPTPLCGDIVECDGKRGVLFERIEDKVSFARALSNNPERLDELAKEFAIMSKKLHATPTDEAVFPNVKEVYMTYVDKFEGLTEEERNRIKRFIMITRDTRTSLHGDFHFGNAIITKDNEKLFIDMSDFSYGDPNFDLGTFYFVTHNDRDNHSEVLFHSPIERLIDFYNHFMKYYFKDMTIEDVDEMLKPFAALTVIHFAYKAKQKPWMLNYVREYLLEKI